MLLELFCGTGSVRKVATALGYRVVSVDVNQRWRPDICLGVQELDAARLEREFGKFDVVWASPDCSQYSCVWNCMPGLERNVAKSNEVVKKTLSLIEHLSPKFWFLENPATGKLRDQSFMRFLPYKDCCYCMYDESRPMRKQTRIWGSGVRAWRNPLMCTVYSSKGTEESESRRLRQELGATCSYYRQHGKHHLTVGRYIKNKSLTQNVSRVQRLQIPEGLLRDLLTTL
jgi:hypothetical protein